MSFFSNAAINRLNLHFGVQTLAQGAGGVFVLVFLLKSGVPLPLVILAQGAWSVGRFVLRPLIVPLARRFGLKAMLVAGTVLEAAIFPILPHVHGLDRGFLAILLLAPLGSLVYWTCYHAYFAALGDEEHRGGQLGAREALAAVVNIAAPLLGGWALVTAGPQVTFWAVAAVQACAALPLLGAPDVAVQADAPGGRREALRAAAMLATDGWFSACYYYVWLIALFITLGESFKAYGGAMAAAGLAGAASGLVLGRLIDLGHGRRSMIAAYAVATGVVLMRAGALETPWLAVVANALGALVAALQATAMMTPVYNLAKASPCTLRFHVATEGGWDIGCASGCAAAAAVAALGLPLSVAILLALPGAGAAVALLWRAYDRPAADLAAAHGAGGISP